ncbi:uncharacterized protein LOC125556674 isoform X1 [Nematostella vectensis]|uniref:uncharacterized protein LOC125556674 isoform X1 n=2 Tax=Nematostella vectensis TaxID=45351 RepID=UPI0020779BA0|nr:uncharacterized protein LOC125556674 isoform X1 [Nematostella vectensis]
MSFSRNIKSEPMTLTMQCRNSIVCSIGESRWKGSELALPWLIPEYVMKQGGGWRRILPIKRDYPKVYSPNTSSSGNSSDLEFLEISLDKSDYSDSDTIAESDIDLMTPSIDISSPPPPLRIDPLVTTHRPANVSGTGRESVIMVPIKSKMCGEDDDKKWYSSIPASSSSEMCGENADKKWYSSISTTSSYEDEGLPGVRQRPSKEVDKEKDVGRLSTETLSALGACDIPKSRMFEGTLASKTAQFQLSEEEWEKIQPQETKHGYSQFTGPWTDIFSDHLKVSNNYCSLKFTYNRIKSKRSRKHSAPFFRGKASCRRKECGVSLELQISMENVEERVIDVQYSTFTVNHGLSIPCARFMKKEKRQERAQQLKSSSPSKLYTVSFRE